MAQRRTYFLVGLFVTVGALIGVVSVIWLGASRYFQKGSNYATYFDESVQGLQVDSIVKYRGVDIGTVKRIAVAPDRRLIEVVMKIEEKGFSVSGVVARLSLAGITGIVYVELDRKKPDDLSFSPKDFVSAYPVIPSSPSGIKQIESGINEILKNMKQIDFKGISDEMMRTAKSIEGFVGGERMNRIVANLSTASAGLAVASERINDIAGDSSIKEAVQGAKEAVVEARATIVQIRNEISKLKVGETAARINQFVERTSTGAQSVLADVQDTTDRLRRVSDSLDSLVDRLSADPSALIFSKPPKGE